MDGIETKSWQGSTVEVRACLIAKYLWTTATIDVLLDDRYILRTGGKLKIVGAVKSEFAHNGTTYQATVSWGMGSLKHFPYQLDIDEERVASGRVKIRNWPMAFAIWVILGAAVSFISNHI